MSDFSRLWGLQGPDVPRRPRHFPYTAALGPGTADPTGVLTVTVAQGVTPRRQRVPSQ